MLVDVEPATNPRCRPFSDDNRSVWTYRCVEKKQWMAATVAVVITLPISYDRYTTDHEYELSEGTVRAIRTRQIAAAGAVSGLLPDRDVIVPGCQYALGSAPTAWSLAPWQHRFERRIEHTTMASKMDEHT